MIDNEVLLIETDHLEGQALHKHERGKKILGLLKSSNVVSVAELSKETGVSIITVRRDLNELAEKNLITRTYGGAVLTKFNGVEPPVITRSQLYAMEKAQIGKAAAELVNEGDTVFLSGGTTTEEVAKNLRFRNNLTVITSAINIVNVFVNFPNINVIVPGGTLIHDHLTLVGHIAKKALTYLRADLAIMGVSAIDVDEGITSETLIDAETDQAIIDFAPEVIVVADSSKFGLRKSAVVASIDQIQHVVTDKGISLSEVKAMQSKGVKVIIASE